MEETEAGDPTTMVAESDTQIKISPTVITQKLVMLIKTTTKEIIKIVKISIEVKGCSQITHLLMRIPPKLILDL